jgi:D-3-phosphoglycerate dehydrogenase
MQAHALLVESIHPAAGEELKRRGIGVTNHPGALNGTDLVDALVGLPGDDPVIVGIRSKSHVTQAVLEAVPRLIAIGAFCIGTDQIDLADARGRGIGVFNAPFSSTRSVAELVLGEIIMLSRQIFPRNAAAHDGKWAKSTTGAHEVRGKTLGIIGYGHIGSQLSILAESLGMRVLYTDIVAKLPLGNAEVRPSTIDMLAECDFITLHVPDTELTRAMFDRAAIDAMKPGAYLINASRGQVVDIDALRDALESGHLAGAAIDVFPSEPAKTGDPFDSPLRGVDNVILTPHIGGSTAEAQANIGREVAGALNAYVDHGSTTRCVTLPEQEAPPVQSGSRLLNVHRNVPGVLSDVNRVVADSGVNIVGQHLATAGDVGLLLVDIAVHPTDERIAALAAAIEGLDASIRTRIVRGLHP